MNPIIAKNFKALREHLGITQAQMAEYLGVIREQVSYYENGEREIPLQILEKSCNLFGIELVDFFSEEPSESIISFAYRADDLDKKDLEEIASFKNIIKNYHRMLKLDIDEKK